MSQRETSLRDVKSTAQANSPSHLTDAAATFAGLPVDCMNVLAHPWTFSANNKKKKNRTYVCSITSTYPLSPGESGRTRGQQQVFYSAAISYCVRWRGTARSTSSTRRIISAASEAYATTELFTLNDSVMPRVLTSAMSPRITSMPKVLWPW